MGSTGQGGGPGSGCRDDEARKMKVYHSTPEPGEARASFGSPGQAER